MGKGFHLPRVLSQTNHRIRRLNNGKHHPECRESDHREKDRTENDGLRQVHGKGNRKSPSVRHTPERFTRITLSALSSNPQLQQTTPQSFLGAMMTAAQLGVEPNTPLGQAYLLPYKNKGVLECQFQLG